MNRNETPLFTLYSAMLAAADSYSVTICDVGKYTAY